VAPNPNPCQLFPIATHGDITLANVALPIAVLSLFKGLAAIARGAWHSPLAPLTIFTENTYNGSFIQDNFSPDPFVFSWPVARSTSPGALSFSD
jgi:hypothetical protein